MCGIAGIINPSSRSSTNNPEERASMEHRLQRMTWSIQHRGPDDHHLWINESTTTGFGHCRLSIIDLTPAAAQPMNYLGRYTIIHNGEIYNYIELRSELQAKGYSFHSS